MGRSILAVVVGVVVGGLLVGLIEFLGWFVYPPPQGFDPQDAEAMAALVAKAPLGAFVIVLVAWAVGSFGGAWVAAAIARRSQVTHGLIVGALLMAAGIVNMLMIPHPLWFWIVGLLIFLPAAWLGARFATRRRAA